MPTDWQKQPGDGPQIAINARRVMTGIAARSSLRESPTVAIAQQWHRDHYDVSSAEVPAALARFERQAQTAAVTLDAAIPAGAWPSGAALSSVITYCAVLHGEWVRIHPFANGNGRTARVWANWAAIRYGLPPFVTIRPRPGQPSYAAAGRASMTADHAPRLGVMLQMLQDRLRSLPPAR